MTYGCHQTKGKVAMRPDQIAVQLYTLRELAAEDLPGTLRAVSGAGFGAVELAGLPPVEAAALRDLLMAEGLTPVGSHESLDRLRADLDGVIDRMTVIGCPRIVVPWLPEADRRSPADVRRVAGELGRMATACEDGGLRLGYHNHAFEFEPLDGTSVWGVLVDELPPNVDLELDVYWAAIGGRDPVELIDGLDDRLRLLHMKDVAASPERNDVAPGDGILPWPAIVSAATKRGVDWYVVERDDPTDAVTQVARGRAHLLGLAQPS
jgi:sugar phosphate isomerase/epimerase